MVIYMRRPWPWYPMAGGKLLNAQQPAAQALDQIAVRHSATVAQLSIAWLLQRSPVMLPIPGTSQVAHLEENLAAAHLKLSPETTAALETLAAS
ncbi:MAG TPA: aldo/keto reductase [Terracidiphilus sp.]|jgi:aryl-alcohol dehydrogenase-like predicted oxidoreductase